MLPKFPNFKKLEFEDKKEIEKITSKYMPYSDFNFVSLYSYDVEEDTLISVLHGNFVIKFRDYVTNKEFYSFIGENKVAETTDLLLKLAHQQGIVKKHQLIPHVNNELKKKYLVREDRDNFDYILSVDLLSKFSGGGFSQKRWRMNKFLKEVNPQVIELDLKNPKVHREIMSLFKQWAKAKQKTKKEYLHEEKAIRRLLTITQRMKFISIGFYKDKKLIGFSIQEILNKDWAIGHFMKTNPSFSGATEALYHLTAKKLKDIKVKYINAEQDLGIESLRYFKSSWKPVSYLKKYTINKK